MGNPLSGVAEGDLDAFAEYRERAFEAVHATG